MGYNTFLILALLFFYINNREIELIVILGNVICINCVSVSRFYKYMKPSADFTFYSIYLLLLSFFTLYVYHLILL